MLRRIFVLSLCTFSISLAVRAADTSDLQDELADLRAKVASMEAVQMAPAAGGDAESLTTLRRTGRMRIGGDVNIDVIYRHRDDVTGSGDNVDSTEFTTNSANLRFKVDASRDAYLYLKLDLDDDQAHVGNHNELLEECKFVFSHVGGSNIGLVFGKGEVPYGQDKTLGIVQSYHHNDEVYSGEGPVILTGGWEEYEGPANPHASVGRTWHPGEVDNVFMLGANWLTLQNRLKFEVAVFQNRGSDYSAGMHEDRPDDNLGFQSYAARVWWNPMEGLTLEASFLKLHYDSRGDEDVYGMHAEDDQYAMSLGFDYNLPRLPLEVFGEYQRGFEWGHLEGYDTHTAQLGLIWTTLNGDLDVGVMGEWLGIDDNGGIDENYWKAVLSAKYRFDSGIYVIAEYAHEWFDGDKGSSGNREADLFAIRTGWAF